MLTDINCILLLIEIFILKKKTIIFWYRLQLVDRYIQIHIFIFLLNININIYFIDEI